MSEMLLTNDKLVATSLVRPETDFLPDQTNTLMFPLDRSKDAPPFFWRFPHL